MIPLPFTLLFWVRIYTPFLCFLSREYPLVFVGELVWCRILSAFACLKSFWFLLHTWMRSLLGTINNLGCSLFSFIILSMSCHSLLAWRVSIERSAVILVCYLEFPCVLFVVFPLLLLFYFIFSMKHSLFIQLNSIQMLESWTSMYQQGQISKTYVNENHKSQKDGYVWSDTIYVKYYSTILYIFFYLLR